MFEVIEMSIVPLESRTDFRRHQKQFSPTRNEKWKGNYEDKFRQASKRNGMRRREGEKEVGFKNVIEARVDTGGF